VLIIILTTNMLAKYFLISNKKLSLFLMLQGSTDVSGITEMA